MTRKINPIMNNKKPIAANFFDLSLIRPPTLVGKPNKTKII